MDFVLNNKEFVTALVAVVVGLLTLLGVLLTNRAATRRMKAEIQHAASEALAERRFAAEEARTERLTQARRQVYLDAIEAWSTTQLSLANLGNSEFSSDDTVRILGKISGAVGKVALVAEQNTAIAARELMAQLSSSVIGGLVPLYEQASHFSTLRFYESRLSKSQAEQDRLLALQRSLIEQGGEDQAGLARIQSLFESEMEFANHMAKLAQDERKKIFSSGQRYRAHHLEWTLSASTQLDTFVCALREELQIATIPEEFFAQTKRLREKIIPQLDALMRELDREMNDDGEEG